MPDPAPQSPAGKWKHVIEAAVADLTKSIERTDLTPEQQQEATALLADFEAMKIKYPVLTHPPNLA